MSVRIFPSSRYEAIGSKVRVSGVSQQVVGVMHRGGQKEGGKVCLKYIGKNLRSPRGMNA